MEYVRTEAQKAESARILTKFMQLRCSDTTIRYMVSQRPETVDAIAEIKGISKEDVLREAIELLVEDGVSNEFAYNMLYMWMWGAKDNKDFTAREAMLYQHISWTNIEGRTYMTNSPIVDLSCK